MRTLGIPTRPSVNFVFRSYDDIKGVNLLTSNLRTARPPKNRLGVGAGDTRWLLTTPFATVKLHNEQDAIQVLLGIEANAESDAIHESMERCFSSHNVVCVPRQDAKFVADVLQMPLLVLTGHRNDEKEIDGVFFRYSCENNVLKLR